MYTKDNPNIKIRLRRWWKSAKENARWKGWILVLAENFIPGYQRLNRLYWMFRHRFINIYHKIDTGLKPDYYDIDSLIVHGMFSLLCRYIEREKDGVKECLDEISHLENNWGEGYNDIPEESRQGHIDAAKDQADNLRETLRLYHWWKEVYPKYQDYSNNPWSKYCETQKGNGTLDNMLNHKPCAFDKDGDPTMYELNFNRESPEEAVASRKALDASHEYEKKCDDEITENLIALIKLRNSLWT
jgi:hypothetical protein